MLGNGHSESLLGLTMASFLLQQGRIRHKITSKCLEMTRDGARLTMSACEANNDYQHWTFKEYDANKAQEYGMLI